MQRLSPHALDKEYSKWEQVSIQVTNLDELKEECLRIEAVVAFYHDITAGEEEVVVLDYMLGLS
jgi:hypothetical protein